jgi:hypothetical protein
MFALFHPAGVFVPLMLALKLSQNPPEPPIMTE